MARTTKRKSSPFNSLFNSRNKLLFILVLVLLFAGVGAWAWHHHDNQKTNIPTNGNPKVATKPYVNLSPPTAQDKQDTQNHKQELTQSNQPTTPTNSDGKKAVTPVVTSSSVNFINGYVAGVFEDGGICTYKITNDSTGQVINQTSQGFENASYTSCTPVHPNLSSGSWSVVLSYSSSTAEGSSGATKVQ